MRRRGGSRCGCRCARSRPELVDREEVPDELPHLDDLAAREPHTKARRVVECLAVARAGAAEEGDRAGVVREHVLELEMESAVGELRYAHQEFEDRLPPAVRARELP